MDASIISSSTPNGLGSAVDRRGGRVTTAWRGKAAGSDVGEDLPAAMVEGAVDGAVVGKADREGGEGVAGPAAGGGNSAAAATVAEGLVAEVDREARPGGRE